MISYSKMAPRRETIASIFTGIISSIIAYIKLNIAMLTLITYQAHYEKLRATLVRLLSMPVARNVAVKCLKKRRQARRRNFWVRPGRTNARWTGFVNQIVVPERWRENFRMSRVSLLIIYDSECSVSKFSVFVPFSRIRVDARKRNESEYVWTRKVLNPHQNVCGYKRIRIRVDGARVNFNLAREEMRKQYPWNIFLLLQKNFSHSTEIIYRLAYIKYYCA